MKRSLDVSLLDMKNPVIAPSYPDTPAERLQAIIAELSAALPMIDSSQPRTMPELGICEVHKSALSDYLYRRARSHGDGITVYRKGYKVTVQDSTLVELDALIDGGTSVIVEYALGKRITESVLIQFWREEGDFWVAPRRNLSARRISKRTVKKLKFFEKGALVHVNALNNFPLVHEPDFPVDIVYTWVDHRDPKWRRLFTEATGKAPNKGGEDNDPSSMDRFLSRDELKYSLRSVDRYASWVRNVYVVTNCSPPDWINLEHPKLHWIDHEEILPPKALPTFSSHAIEARLQHIPGLSNHFLYFNDDFFLTRPARVTDFFQSNGLSKSAMEPYGTVSGEVAKGDADYLNAARNGKSLLEKAFGKSVTSLHTHTPYALRKDVLLEMEERFKEPIEQTIHNAFRTPEDISTVSFLYHHYSYMTQRAVYSELDSVLIKARRADYPMVMADILTGKRVPVAVCINDGSGSSHMMRWNQHVSGFLDTYFPHPSAFETGEGS